MKSAVVIALIAAFPPTLVAVLGYIANNRSIRRSVGTPSGLPLGRAIERLDRKLDRLTDGQSEIRERLARLEERSPVSRIWGGKLRG